MSHFPLFGYALQAHVCLFLRFSVSLGRFLLFSDASDFSPVFTFFAVNLLSILGGLQCVSTRLVSHDMRYGRTPAMFLLYPIPTSNSFSALLCANTSTGPCVSRFCDKLAVVCGLGILSLFKPIN